MQSYGAINPAALLMIKAHRRSARLLHRDLAGIASSMTISRFGYSLVAVFVPFLLLQKGLALWQICLFYTAYGACKIILNYPATVLSVRRGVRFGLTVGYSANAAYFLILTAYLSGHAEWALYALPLLMAIDHAFTWGAQHLHIAHAMDITRTGKDIAFIHSLAEIVGIVAPITGGLLAVYLGKPWLAGIAALCIMAALIPIRKAGPLHATSRHTPQLAYNLKGAPRRDLFANYLFNIHATVSNVLWPVYLAVVLTTITSIGLVATASAGVAFILLYIAGHRGDRGYNHRVLLESTALTSLTHIGRIFATTPLGAGIVSSLSNVALSYQQIPWTSLYYRHARTGGVAYIVSMEIMCDLACITFWGVLSLVAYYTKSHAFFVVAFAIAAVAAWGCMRIRQDKI